MNDVCFRLTLSTGRHNDILMIHLIPITLNVSPVNVIMLGQKGALLIVFCVHVATCDYTSKLLKVSHCKGPVPPYAKGKRLIEDYITIVHKDNETLLSGNATFHDQCQQCKCSISVLRETKGARRPMIHFKDMTCKHVLVQMFNAVFGIPTDYKTCARPLGTYAFKDIDINKVVKKIRLPFRTNGIYYYEVSLFVKELTHLCFEVKVAIMFTTTAETKAKKGFNTAIFQKTAS